MPAMRAGFIKFRAADPESRVKYTEPRFQRQTSPLRRERASMMKLPVVGIVLILASAVLLAQQRLNPELKYIVSPSESQVEFHVHSTFAEVNGVFSSYKAEFKVPTPRFEDISFSIEVGAASVRTGNGAKDKMVKGERFFWVQKHSSITFVSKHITRDAGDPLKFAMEGDFTIRGVTKPVTLQLTLQPDGKQRAHLYADLSFDRREFGMTYNMPLNRISDSVRVRFDLYVQGTSVPGDP